MKIGVLTYFGDLNSGTNLQAYSVVGLLQRVYPQAEVQVIDYHPFRRRWKPYLTDFTVRSLVLDVSRLRKYAAFVRGLPLTDRRLAPSSREEASAFFASFGFDMIFVGSDTLLELHRNKADALTPYWLSPTIPAKKVFLAPSAREAEFAALSPRQQQELRECLAGIDRISVRDAGTMRLMASCVPESSLTMLPDPTFSMDVDPEPARRFAARKGLDKQTKPVVCLHLNRRDAHSDAIADGFRKRGYVVASLRPARYADIQLNDIGPLEIAGIFRYFAFVVTHRFHDSIFCYKNGTPVLTYTPPDYVVNSQGQSKFRSLHEMFGLEETNLVSRVEDFSAQRILQMADGAIAAFKSASQVISDRLEANRRQLVDFVSQTRPLVGLESVVGQTVKGATP